MPRFVKDTGFTILTRILGRFFGLFSVILLARFLGPDGNGYYTLAFLLSSTAIALMNFGLPPTAVYYIAQGKHPHAEILGHLFLLNVTVTTVAMLVGWLIVSQLKGFLFPQTPQYYLFLGILIIPGAFTYRFFQSVLLGLQRFDLYNFGQIFWSFVHFLLIAVVIVIFKKGVSGAIAAEAASWVVGAALLFYWAKVAIPRWSFRFNPPLAKEMVTYGIQSYVGNLLAFFNYRADLFLINFFQGPAAVGVYSVAVGLAERLWLISQTASTVLLPRVSAANDPDWRRRFTPLITRTVFVIVLPAALLIGVFAQPLVKILYSRAFLGAVRPLQILLVGIVTFSLSRVLAQDIAGRGKPILNTYTSALALVINVVLNLLLIPVWGIRGAALASAVSYTALLVSKLLIYYRLSGNPWREVVWSKKTDWRLYFHTIALILRRLRGEKRSQFREDDP